MIKQLAKTTASMGLHGFTGALGRTPGGRPINSVVGTLRTVGYLGRTLGENSKTANMRGFETYRKAFAQVASSGTADPTARSIVNGSSFCGVVSNISTPRSFKSHVSGLERIVQDEAARQLSGLSGTSSRAIQIKDAINGKQFKYLTGRIRTGQIDVEAIIASGSFNGVSITPGMAQALRDINALAQMEKITAAGQNDILAKLGQPSAVASFDMMSRRQVNSRIKDFQNALERSLGTDKLSKLSVKKLKKLNLNSFTPTQRAAIQHLTLLKEQAQALGRVGSGLTKKVGTASFIVQKLGRGSDAGRAIGEIKSTYNQSKLIFKMSFGSCKIALKGSMKTGRFVGRKVNRILYRLSPAPVRRAIGSARSALSWVGTQLSAIKTRAVNSVKRAASGAKNAVKRAGRAVGSAVKSATGKVGQKVSARLATRKAKKASKKAAKRVGKKGIFSRIGAVFKKMKMLVIKILLFALLFHFILFFFGFVLTAVNESALSLNDTLFGDIANWVAGLHWPWTFTEEDRESGIENTIRNLTQQEKGRFDFDDKSEYINNMNLSDILGGKTEIPSFLKVDDGRVLDEADDYGDLKSATIKMNPDNAQEYREIYYYKGDDINDSYIWIDGDKIPINQFSTAKLIISMGHTCTYIIEEKDDLANFGEYCNAMSHVLRKEQGVMLLRTCEDGDFTISYDCTDGALRNQLEGKTVLFSEPNTTVNADASANAAKTLCVLGAESKLFPSYNNQYGCIKEVWYPGNRVWTSDGQTEKAGWTAYRYDNEMGVYSIPAEAKNSNADVVSLLHYLGLSQETAIGNFETLAETVNGVKYFYDPLVPMACLREHYGLTSDTLTTDKLSYFLNELHFCSGCKNIYCEDCENGCMGHRVCMGHYESCKGHMRCDGHEITCCSGHDSYSFQTVLFNENIGDALFDNHDVIIPAYGPFDNKVVYHTADDSPHEKGKASFEGDYTYTDANGNQVTEKVTHIYAKTRTGFQGWRDEDGNLIQSTVDMVWGMFRDDWYIKYGISADNFLGGQLSDGERNAILNEVGIGSGTEEWRRNLCNFALSAVGRVPYYPKMEPTEPGYTGFGKVTDIVIDDDGVAHGYTGLDPKYFAYWVYWSCNGNADGTLFKATGHLRTPASSGTTISSDVLPGTAIISKNADTGETITGIFLGMTEDSDKKAHIVTLTDEWATKTTVDAKDWFVVANTPVVSGVSTEEFEGEPEITEEDLATEYEDRLADMEELGSLPATAFTMAATVDGINPEFNLQSMAKSAVNLAQFKTPDGTRPLLVAGEDGERNLLSDAYDVVKPVGMALLVLLFLIELLSESTTMHFNADYLIKKLFALAICAIILMYGADIMGYLLSAADEMLTVTEKALNAAAEKGGMSQALYYDLMTTSSGDAFTTIAINSKSLVYITTNALYYVLTLVAVVCIFYVAFGRVLALTVRYIFAPIGIATLISGNAIARSSGMTFFKKFASLCLVGALIVGSVGASALIRASMMDTPFASNPIVPIIIPLTLIGFVLHAEGIADDILGEEGNQR